MEEILKVVQNVVEYYLTEEQAVPFNPSTGILRRLKRAQNIESMPDFVAAVGEYNESIVQLRKDGVIAANLDKKHDVPLGLLKCIMTQIYDRAVSPTVDSLRQYEPGSDGVYGELLAPFVSRIFEEVHLKSGDVFVDLGSGVGNVVLQAALEIGCESWGCEFMPNASKIADLQAKEFAARCRMWGIGPGKVKLEKTSFFENDNIVRTLQRADVVLVNNQVFGADTNRRLVDLFLDLKDGCKIVSLKSFVQDENITYRNENDTATNLKVVRKEYFSGSVSWTDASGVYFIATKKGRKA